MWKANIITLLPDAYPGLLGMSVVGKALNQQIWNMNIVNIREFSNKNGKSDVSPFGGELSILRFLFVIIIEF